MHSIASKRKSTQNSNSGFRKMFTSFFFARALLIILCFLFGIRLQSGTEIFWRHDDHFSPTHSHFVFTYYLENRLHYEIFRTDKIRCVAAGSIWRVNIIDFDDEQMQREDDGDDGDDGKVAGAQRVRERVWLRSVGEGGGEKLWQLQVINYPQTRAVPDRKWQNMGKAWQFAAAQ